MGPRASCFASETFFVVLGTRYVQMTLSRVIDEMVLDGGGHFSPEVIDGVYTLTSLFSSYTAHSRAEGNPI